MLVVLGRKLTGHKATIGDLEELVRQFSEERDWDQFHNAKELAIGIVTESSELLQRFRFKSESDVDSLFANPDSRREISEEVSDVLYFILRLAQLYRIDLAKELKKKVKKNAERYPLSKSKGSNKKYSEL
jgi:NTP pyrophosphatase (non-canonical NTP hydrolase)